MTYRSHLVLLLAVLFSFQLFGQLELTEDEQNWIRESSVLKVANEMDWPPFDFAENGEARGYSIDLMKLIADKTGLEIQFVNGYTWTELLELFKTGKIDILPAFYLTEDRKEYIAYTTTYASNEEVLATHQDHIHINSIEDLAGKKVALIKGYATAEAVEQRYPEIKRVFVVDALEGLSKVSTNEVEAFIGSIGTISNSIENNFIPNIRIKGSVDLKTLEETQLHIGVLKEQEILRNILEKGLQSISKEEKQKVRDKWLPMGNTEKEQVGGEKSTIDYRWLIAILGAIAFSLVIIRFLAKRIISEQSAYNFGSRKFRFIVMISTAVVVIAVFLTQAIVLHNVKAKVLNNTTIILQSTLENTNTRLSMWVNQRLSLIKQYGKSQEITNLISVVVDSTTRPDSERLEAFSKLDNYFKVNNYDFQDSRYFVIGKEGKILATDQRKMIGTEFPLLTEHGDLWSRAFHGDVIFIPPMLIGMPNGAGGNIDDVILCFVSPIRNQNNEVSALLIKPADPSRGFSQIFQLSRMGQTGESYAFDHQGWMLSESRFTDDLKDIGLLKEFEHSVFQIKLLDPGQILSGESEVATDKKTLPLTYMARNAIGGNTGSNVQGYRDYRGIPVFGAWLWDQEYEMGLTVEIDKAEALYTFHSLQKTAWMVMIITMLIMVSALLFTLSVGEKSNAALMRAKDELEHRVEERTMELQQSQSELQTKSDSLEEAYVIIKGQKDRMEEELNVGKDIQMSMLPLIFPAFPQRDDFDIYARLEPAREVGGDFYDFALIDDRHLYFTVGDVSGKGVPAALMMAVSKTLLRSSANSHLSTAQILTLVNKEMAKENKNYMFVTIFVGILDTVTGDLTYSNAGHNPTYIKRADGSVLKLSELHGPVVAAMEDLKYGESKIRIHQNDSIFMYTDGIPEAHNSKGEMFTDERLQNFLETTTIKSSEVVINEILDEVSKFEKNQDPFDDITALNIIYLGVPDAENQDRSTMNLTIKSNLDEIAIIQEGFNEYAENQNIAAGIAMKVNIVIDELLTNIIKYSFDDGLIHDIGIKFECRNNKFLIELIDDGMPFNPFQATPPDIRLSVEDRPIGGLGLHLVKNLMDEYVYERIDNQNHLFLAKHLDQPIK